MIEKILIIKVKDFFLHLLLFTGCLNNRIEEGQELWDGSLVDIHKEFAFGELIVDDFHELVHLLYASIIDELVGWLDNWESLLEYLGEEEEGVLPVGCDMTIGDLKLFALEVRCPNPFWEVFWLLLL